MLLYGILVYGLQVSRLKCSFNSKIYRIFRNWFIYRKVCHNILHMSHGMYSFLMSFKHEPEFSNQRQSTPNKYTHFIHTNVLFPYCQMETRDAFQRKKYHHINLSLFIDPTIQRYVFQEKIPPYALTQQLNLIRNF